MGGTPICEGCRYAGTVSDGSCGQQNCWYSCGVCTYNGLDNSGAECAGCVNNGGTNPTPLERMDAIKPQ